MIKFTFNEKKTAQAASHLIKLHGGPLNYMKLIKLLYLSDRQSLIEMGFPITGDQMVSMPHGPVLSMVLDLINMGKERETPWFQHISEPERYEVKLKNDSPNLDELSKYEIQVLNKIYKQFGSLDKYRLRDLTHTLPEWDDPEGSSCPIDPQKILQLANIPSEDIRHIAEKAEEHRFLNQFNNLNL